MSKAGILHEIPDDVSNMLFAYLSTFSNYELTKIKEVYKHQLKCESNRSEYIDIMDCVDTILKRRESEENGG